MDVESHPTSEVADSGIRVGSTVVEELGDGLGSGFSALAWAEARVPQG